ncbi:type II toxin-antitoxin system VapC family toxin [Nodularia sp. NIES-3585]|uniref:type II toxin-antitoxin system VapC family toxin n=1 Tax=Nodularia sp. NIES-3585 TaxID=1973477 RepID=UPI000B6806D5|nr:type II toxin-antitoxin system VapC family toxin [Nodularia sp. NIES-3585]GAX35886.1 PilT domain-containing protein [Nodularia sp. NIES-3585]
MDVLAKPLPSGQYFISVITEIELLSYPSLNLEEEIQIRDLIEKITVINLESNIKELAIRFRKEYKLKLPDAIIVATAKSLNATLVTNDIKLTNLTKINTQSVQFV